MGHSGDVLLHHVDLIPFPFQVRSYLDNLVRIAQGLVDEGVPLPPTMMQLLEQADGLALSLQGPPGTGKTTVTGELIARLVGDQQQLSQLNRAAHPEDSGLNGLDDVIADRAVVLPDQGVFLATRWRMPPALTAVVSELFYTAFCSSRYSTAATAPPAAVSVWFSRAQCLSTVVGSPELATGVSTRIANVRRLSRLCRLLKAN